MKKFGIDTSRWQGDFDFAKAKKEEGVEFAIIKAGGGDDVLYKDSQFENSYKKCVECGLDKGAYFFGHAMTMEDAKKEAAYFIELLKGKKFEYPVFYDVEGDMLTLDRKTLTNICLYVLQTVQDAGYWVGIYTSESQFNNEVIDEELTGFSHWVAKYSASEPKLNSKAEVQMWQFGGETNLIRSNKINNQTVDQNYCYIDYPALIKAKGLNGYSKVEEVKQEEVKVEPTKAYKAGQVINLKDTALFSTASSETNADTITGTYYLWSDEVVNNRIRITNAANRVGVRGQVTGFINVADIKGTTTATKTVKEGVKVKVKKGAKFYTGETPKDFVYDTTYDALNVDGKKVKIGIGSVTTGYMHIDNLIVQ